MMFILAVVDVYKLFCTSVSFFGMLVLNVLCGFMKWFVRNKTAVKRKMTTFNMLVLSYMHTTLYILFFYSNNLKKFYGGVKIQEKV